MNAFLKRNIFPLIVFFSTIVFILFILMYNQHLIKVERMRIKEHARVITSAVWNLDFSNSTAYFKIASKNYHYSRVIVTDTKNNIMFEMSENHLDAVDRFLFKIGLIPTFEFKSMISFSQQTIGYIQVFWQSMVIYVAFYGSILLVLILINIKIYIKLVINQKHLKLDIEKRIVAEKKLKESQLKLIEISRMAGMSEVITGILHNIGNILNSVNISVDVIYQKVTNSCWEKFSQIIPIIEGNIGKLDEYFVNDDKGRLVPKILNAITRDKKAEDDFLEGELKTLKINIDHIKDIITVQQSFAGTKSIIEEVSLTSLIEQAVQIDTVALGKYSIELIKDYSNDIVVTSDRLKILQILINLITNAKDALLSKSNTEYHKKLQISLREDSDGYVHIKVTDSGIGIDNEDLIKIFQHGYTTKKNGHGFGLHHSALSAKELGGTLTATSEGKDRGSTFILSIPKIQRVNK